tara:strand:- start:5166 stop:6092 length:927 start_codon:yes stop_codon:yes gene_type:complete
MAMSELLKYLGIVGADPFVARTATIAPEIEQQQVARQIKDITGIDIYKPPPPPMPEIDLLSIPQRRGQASLTPAIIGEEQGPPRPPSLMPQEIDIAGAPAIIGEEQGPPRPTAIIGEEQGTPVAPKRDSERLGLMLYALGGALRGDKDFVSKTIQLREMKEGKKKEAEQKKAFDEFLKTLDPDSPFYDLAKAMGPQNLNKLLLERYKASVPKEETSAQMRARLARKVSRGEKLTRQDLDTLTVIDPGFGDLLYTNPELFESGAVNQNEVSIQDNNVLSVPQISTQKEYNELPLGTEYIFNGIKYKKGE